MNWESLGKLAANLTMLACWLVYRSTLVTARCLAMLTASVLPPATSTTMAVGQALRRRLRTGCAHWPTAESLRRNDSDRSRPCLRHGGRRPHCRRIA